jgi:hypothetical protein
LVTIRLRFRGTTQSIEESAKREALRAIPDIRYSFPTEDDYYPHHKGRWRDEIVRHPTFS